MKFPLTAFVIDMLRGQLATRDARTLAKEYGIRPEFAAGYLRLSEGEK